MKILPVVTALSLSAAALGRPDSELQTSAYRASIAQDEVRRKAEQAKQQLARFLEDLQLSGLDSPEAALARQAAENLATLGNDQMAPLIRTLKEAGTGADATGARGTLTKASVEQKHIEMSLKAMAGGMAKHHDEASIPTQLEKLLLRQIANRRQTRALPKSDPSEDLKSLCQAEQETIRQQLDLFLDHLRRVATEGPPRFASARTEMEHQGVPAMAAAASSDLAAGKLPAGIEYQTRLVAAFEATLDRLKSETPAAERLCELARDVQSLAREQSTLADAAERARDSARRDLQEAQFRLTDRLAALQQEIQDLNAGAAEKSRAASTAMTKAAEDFLRSDRNSIASQREGAGHLRETAKELESGAAQLTAQAPQPDAAQTLADLARLSQQIEDTRHQADTQPPTAGNQEQLAHRAAALQQQVLPQSAEAARNLGEAAAQLQQGNTPRASQALANANAAVRAQMQAAARAAARQQQLQELNRRLAAARDGIEQAEAGLQQTPAGQNLMGAIRQTESAENALQGARQEAERQGAPGAARQAMEQAQRALQRSRQAAAQLQAGAALAANAEAGKALHRASQAVQQAAQGAFTPAPPSPEPQQGQTGGAMAGREGETVPGFLPNAGGTGSGFAAAGRLRPQDREALAALQNESAPLEYRNMANQYLKNLASGEFPADPLP